MHVDAIAARFNVRAETVLATVQRAKKVLYDARAKRVWPGRDEKVLAGWNGLALRGVSEAARVFGRDDFATLALRNAQFLRDTMVRDGRVMRTHKDGMTRIPGFLEDHASVALGFLAVFEQTLDTAWLTLARAITDAMLQWFWDGTANTLYDTAHDAETLITRPRDVTDNAIPSGTSLAVDLLFRLADYIDEETYQERARTVLESFMSAIIKYPTAFGHLLGAAEYAETFACHGEYCDMPSPRALELARGLHAAL
jgi:uncharacterized protein YyaL (SSP411 family)